MCDIGGQLKSLWQDYFAECHGIIFFIDSADQTNLQNSLDAFGSFPLKEKRKRNQTKNKKKRKRKLQLPNSFFFFYAIMLAFISKHESLQDVPVLIVANKQDLNDVAHIDDLLEQMKPLVMDFGERDCRLQPLSALQGFLSHLTYLFIICELTNFSSSSSIACSSGVEEAINWLVQHMEFNQKRRPKRFALD